MAFEDGVFATFYDDAILNKFKTKQNGGEPTFDEVVMIKIVVPNQVDSVPRPATDADKKRFPKSWEAYETGREAPEDGTMVQHWPMLTGGELKVLQACQIKTVEQLADLPDSGLHRLGPGAQNLKQRAIRYLKSQTRVSELEEENKKLKEKLAAIEEPKPKRKSKNIRVA